MLSTMHREAIDNLIYLLTSCPVTGNIDLDMHVWCELHNCDYKWEGDYAYAQSRDDTPLWQRGRSKMWLGYTRRNNLGCAEFVELPTSAMPFRIPHYTSSIDDAYGELRKRYPDYLITMQWGSFADAVMQALANSLPDRTATKLATSVGGRTPALALTHLLLHARKVLGR